MRPYFQYVLGPENYVATSGHTTLTEDLPSFKAVSPQHPTILNLQVNLPCPPGPPLIAGRWAWKGPLCSWRWWGPSFALMKPQNPGSWGSGDGEKAGRTTVGRRPSAKLSTPPHAHSRDPTRRENSFVIGSFPTVLKIKPFLRRSTPHVIGFHHAVHKLSSCCKLIMGGCLGTGEYLKRT